MDRPEMIELAHAFLTAWNTHEVDRVLACYTDDVSYRDPNTRGAVVGHAAMARYLGKLFAGWRMHWTLREAHLFEGGEGCSVLWHATFTKSSGGPTVELDGMDLVEMRGGRIARNEVQFDRAALMPLM